MIDSYARQSFQRLLVDPVIQHWPKRPGANALTVSALLLGICAALCIIWQQGLAAIVFLALSGYCDVLDGSLARQHNTSSINGTILDIICDRVVEFAIIFGFYLQQPGRALLCLLMLGAMYLCITSFLVISCLVENTSEKGFHYSPGLIERAETFIFFAAMIVLPQWFKLLAIVYASLVLLTVLIRVRTFIKDSDNEKL